MSEWKEYNMSELIDEIAMGPFGSNIKVDCFVKKGVPVLNGSNLTGFKLSEKSFNYVTKEKAESLGRSNAKRGDIIVTHRGTLGQVSYIPDDSSYDSYVISQSQFRFSCKKNLVFVPYLVYYFHSREGQYKLLSNACQVGVPALARPTSTFKEISVILPPIEEQKRIGGVLSSLDDKIDLLHRENATLEALAETLFRHYFIEKPNPDWKEGNIADVVDFNPARKLGKGENAPYVEMANVGTNDYAPSTWRIRPFQSGTKFINGDALMARISPCLENGKAAFVDFLEREQVGWGSTEFIVMRSKLGIHPFFVYVLSKYDDFRDHAVSSLVGSSGRQRVDLDNLIKYPFIIPDKQAIELFNHELNTIFPKIQNNQKQIHTLTAQRDTLLSRLMNGEVNVVE